MTEWKLVPVEPTLTQTRAGQLGVTTTCANAIYRAMLAAAPQPTPDTKESKPVWQTQRKDGAWRDNPGPTHDHYSPYPNHTRILYTAPTPDVAQLQSDLNDARSGWESAADACQELDDELRVARQRIAELERQQAVLGDALNHTAQYIAWREFGECRGFDAAIATPAQVIEIARAALAAVKPSAYVPPKPNHQVQSLIEAARCLGVAQAKGDHTQHWESAVADLSVALNAAAKPAGQEGGEQPDADRSFAPEYEVWQDDIMVASASGHRPDAIREILHYAAQYQQDGPVQIFEVRRQLCSAEELVFAQNGLTEAKKADVMINGLTEAETTASASVAGLMGGA